MYWWHLYNIYIYYVRQLQATTYSMYVVNWCVPRTIHIIHPVYTPYMHTKKNLCVFRWDWFYDIYIYDIYIFFVESCIMYAVQVGGIYNYIYIKNKYIDPITILQLIYLWKYVYIFNIICVYIRSIYIYPCVIILLVINIVYIIW